MKFLHHFFRDFRENEHEDREIFDTLAPAENLAEKITDTLKTEGKESEAAELLEQNADQSELLDQLKEQFEKTSEAERQIIDMNLREVGIEAAKTNRDKLKTAIETLQSQKDQEMKEAAKKTIEAVTDTVTQAVDTAKNGVQGTAWKYVKDQLDISKWREWSDTKKVVVATATVGLAGLAYGAYRGIKKMFGGGEKQTSNEGFSLKKLLLWIPVIGAATLGGTWLYYRWKKNHPEAGADKKETEPTVVDRIEQVLMTSGAAVEGTYKGVRAGAERISEQLGPLATRMTELPNVWPVLYKYYVSHEYTSKVAFMADLAAAMAKEGAGFVYEGGKATIVLGSEVILDVGNLGHELVQLALDPSYEQMEECFEIYVEGAVVYASSIAAYRAAMLRNPVPGWKETVAWPFMVIKKSAGVSWGILTGDTPSYVYNVAQSKMKFFKYAGLRTEHLILSKREVTLGMFQARKEMLIEFDDILKKVHGNPLVTEEFIKKLQDRKTHLVEGLKKILLRLEEDGKLPENMKNMLTKKYNGQKIGSLSLDGIERFSLETNALETTAEVADELAKTQGAVNAAVESADIDTKPMKAAVGAETPRMAEKPKLTIYNPEAAEVKTKINVARAAGDEAELAALLENPALKVAAQQGDEEARSLLKAYEFAKRYIARAKPGIRIAGKVAAPALIGLGVAFDTYLVMDNDTQLETAKQKNDASEVQRLEARGISLRASRVGGITSIMLGATPAGLALGIAVGISSYYTEAVYESVAEWNKSAKEWQKLDAAKLLEEIERFTAEVSAANVTANPSILNYDSSTNVINSSVRNEIYAAYLTKTTVTPKLEAETEQQYIDRLRRVVLNKLEYVTQITNGAMDRVTTFSLRQADAYAELMNMKEELLEKKQSLLLTYETKNGTQMLNLERLNMITNREESERMIDSYLTVVKPELMASDAMLAMQFEKEYPGRAKNTITSIVMQEMRHDILRAEQNIRRSFEEGYFERSQEDHRIALRMLLKQKLEQGIANVSNAASLDGFNGETYTRTIATVRASIEAISGDPEAAYENAPENIKNRAYTDEEIAQVNRILGA